MATKSVLDALIAEMGGNGFQHVSSSDGTVTPSDGADEFFLLLPANGTTPQIDATNTSVATGDNFVDADTVPSEGYRGAITELALSQGEVYAYRR